MSKLKKYLIEQKEKLNRSDKELAELSGIDKGNFSKLLNDEKKEFTINTLEKINKAFNLPKRTIFTLFIDDLIGKQKGYTLYQKNYSIIEYLCEIKLFDLAIKLAESMKGKEKVTSDYFFGLAEKMLSSEKNDEALVFYDLAASLERNTSSQMYALCKYKQFDILRKKDLQQVYDIAMEFSLYIRYLDSTNELTLLEKLEAYRKLIATFYALEKFETMYRFCDELSQIAWDKEFNNIAALSEFERKCISFFGYALVYKGFAARSLKDYEYALQIINEYEKIEFGPFKKWAFGNRLFVQIDKGELDKIEPLLAFMEENPDLNNSAITLAIQTYLKHEKVKETGELLNKYRRQIENALSTKDFFYQKWSIDLLLGLSRYYRLTNQLENSRNNLLEAIKVTINLRQKKKFIECVTEYNKYFVLFNQSDNIYLDLMIKAEELF